MIWDARRKAWRIVLLAAGKKYGFTGIADEIRAAVLRDRLALHVGGKGAAKLNFPRRRLAPGSPAHAAVVRDAIQRGGPTVRGPTQPLSARARSAALRYPLEYPPLTSDPRATRIELVFWWVDRDSNPGPTD